MGSDGCEADAPSADPAEPGLNGPDRAAPAEVDPRRDRTLWMLAMAAVVVLTDQLTKWWATSTLDDRTIDIVWTLRLRLVFNTGAAFSVAGGLGPVLGLSAVVITALLLWMGRVSPNRPSAVALGAIAGGALGNLVDRVFRDGDGVLGGAVVDFIDVQWWPVWNVADMAIVGGGAALVLFTARRE